MQDLHTSAEQLWFWISASIKMFGG